MYDDLVERLRAQAEVERFYTGEEMLYSQAADAIEELSKRVPPVPHGRLIDADAFFDDLLFPSKQFEQGMRELVGDAPTIVPAEEAPAEDINVPTGPYDLLYEEGGANTA